MQRQPWSGRSQARPALSAGGAPAALVGRDGELRLLTAALAEAAAGHGGTRFLAGEAGIGKTRLAHEALAVARARGFQVLEGRAYPLEGGLAYAPLLDAFAPLLRRLDPTRRAALALGAEALALYERAGDMATVARVRRMLAVAEWDRGRLDAAQAQLAAGLEALAGRGPSQELADLHYERVVNFRRLGDAMGLDAVAKELRALADCLATPRAAIQADIAAGDAQLARGDYQAARAIYLRGVATAEAAGELLLAQRAVAQAALATLPLGDFRLGRVHAARSVELARRLGAPPVEIPGAMCVVCADLLAGDWDGALRHSAEAIARTRRSGVPRGATALLGIRALTLAWRGDLDEAADAVAEARASFGDRSGAERHAFSSVDIADTVLALERGLPGRAREIAAVFARTFAPSVLRQIGLAALAQAQVADGHPWDALETAGALAALDPTGGAYSTALARRAAGLAHAALHAPAAAGAALTEAIALFDRLALPFESARARLEQAELTPDAGSATSVVTALQASLVTFEQVGARRHADRARRLLHQLGARPPAPRRARPNEQILSARELEVARLVAEGLTNAEIAERLVVSPRTVTTHLDHIYTRLGIGSRAALARYVTRTEG